LHYFNLNFGRKVEKHGCRHYKRVSDLCVFSGEYKSGHDKNSHLLTDTRKRVDMSVGRRVAIVTGAASGIGKAIALKLASDGFDVALNDLPSSLEQLDEVAALASQSGGNTILIPGDVSSDVDVEKMVDDTVERLGGLDAVCTTLLLIWLRSTIRDVDGSQRRYSRSTSPNNRTFVPVPYTPPPVFDIAHEQ
jgi:hypothetical protein